VRGFRRLLNLVLIVGLAAIVGAFLLGPFVVKVFFDTDLSRRTVTMLALSSALYMVALALAQAIIALRGHARVAIGWAIGLGTFLAVVAIPDNDLLLRVELSLVAGSFAAMVYFGVVAWIMIRAGIVPDEDSLYEALDTLPMEL
jgi:O-antigen/teichoic acid export membrane protein